ncbi:MAG: hypothetical protein SFX18_01480 [Pirellulales bacterium]|nr:hypothetical protein [Pirellulales bacterium]
MSRTMPLQVAATSLEQLIAGMIPGEEIILTVEGLPQAIVTKPVRTTWPCQPGSAKDTEHWMAPDFNGPLDDFAPQPGSLLTMQQRNELDSRLNDDLANPDDVIPWETIQAATLRKMQSS